MANIDRKTWKKFELHSSCSILCTFALIFLSKVLRLLVYILHVSFVFCNFLSGFHLLSHFSLSTSSFASKGRINPMGKIISLSDKTVSPTIIIIRRFCHPFSSLSLSLSLSSLFLFLSQLPFNCC